MLFFTVVLDKNTLARLIMYVRTSLKSTKIYTS